MSNTHVTEKLPLWVSGDLSAQETLSVQAHLDSCPACRSEAQAYKETLSWLREPVEAPFTQEERDGVRNGVMAKIRQSQQSAKSNNPPNPTIQKASNVKRFIPWLLAAAASIPAAMMFYSQEEKAAPKTVVASARPGGPMASQQLQQTGAVSSDATQTSLEQAAYKPVKRSNQSAYSARAKSRPAGLERETSVIRIEFQTEDPNIRIIWFPKPDSSTTDLTDLTDLTDITNL